MTLLFIFIWVYQCIKTRMASLSPCSFKRLSCAKYTLIAYLIVIVTTKLSKLGKLGFTIKREKLSAMQV